MRLAFQLCIGLLVAASVDRLEADETALLSRYKGNRVVLKEPYSDKVIRFSGGVTQAKKGTWAEHSSFLWESAKLEPGRLVIKGRRLVAVYNKKSALYQFTKLDDKVSVEIDTRTPETRGLSEILDEVFDKTQTAEPPQKEWIFPTDKAPPCAARESPASPAATNSSVDLQGGEKQADSGFNLPLKTGAVTHPLKTGAITAPLKTGAVSAPRAISSPDPEYSKVAELLKLQGTVVLYAVITETGQVKSLRVKEPLGGGLDEKAVEAISGWKFRPAMRDGCAVSVAVNIEVKFTLY